MIMCKMSAHVTMVVIGTVMIAMIPWSCDARSRQYSVSEHKSNRAGRAHPSETSGDDREEGGGKSGGLSGDVMPEERAVFNVQDPETKVLDAQLSHKNEITFHEQRWIEETIYYAFEEQLEAEGRDLFSTHTTVPSVDYHGSLGSRLFSAVSSEGQLIGLCECKHDAEKNEWLLEGMNVLEEFQRDKVSSELAGMCFAYFISRNIGECHTLNNGEEAGAISYARGAFMAGYTHLVCSKHLTKAEGPRIALSRLDDEAKKDALLDFCGESPVYMTFIRSENGAAASSVVANEDKGSDHATHGHGGAAGGGASGPRTNKK